MFYKNRHRNSCFLLDESTSDKIISQDDWYVNQNCTFLLIMTNLTKQKEKTNKKCFEKISMITGLQTTPEMLFT